MNRIGLQALPCSSTDATRLAARLGAAAEEIAVHRFPDGEQRVTVGQPALTTLVYASLDRPDDKLITLLFAAEALRRNGAARLILVAPYLCYMRQDSAFQRGQAISQKVVGELIAGAFDRVVTVNAHLHRTSNLTDVFPGAEADNLSAAPAIAATLQGIDQRTVVIGPDAESAAWVGDIASRLGLAHAVANKERHGDRSVDVSLSDPQQIAGRPVLLVDDIVSSGGTLTACAKALAAAGATAVDAVVAHALFSAETAAVLMSAGIRSIRSTNSVSHPTNAIALDNILAEALKNERSNIATGAMS